MLNVKCKNVKCKKERDKAGKPPYTNSNEG
jgi:hypothetical protein